MWRSAVFLALALLLGTQSFAFDRPNKFDSDYDAMIVLSVGSTGTLSISILFNGLTRDVVRTALDAVPREPGTHWTMSGDGSIFTGVCSSCLRPAGDGPAILRLSGLFSSLYESGVGSAQVHLLLHKATPDSLPTGWESESKRSAGYYAFASWRRSDLPPDLPLIMDPPFARWRLFVPIAVMVFVPTVLAYVIRQRATNASAGQKVNWMVWMNWINLTAWLYWISAVRPSQIGDFLGAVVDWNYAAALVLGAALWSIPPLAAVAGCLLAMAPLLSSSRESFRILLKRNIAAEATFVVPLGIFLIGTELTSSGAGFSATLGMVIGYVAYRGLAWVTWTMSYADVRPLESGELYSRAEGLAREAGVTIARWSVLRTRVPEEANAFAMSGQNIVLTESLIKGLTPREVDAVIAHELGHHKAGHLNIDWGTVLFWVYLIGAGPLLAWLISQFHFPTWFMSLPITSLLFVVVRGQLSQKREYVADARAVEITGDPEGTIAALARLIQMSRVPAGDRGMMGSIMSHPSMERRVLALASKHDVPVHRALKILANPDTAYQDTVPAPVVDTVVVSPPVIHANEPVFTLRAKAGLIEQLGWIRLLAPLAGALLIAVPLGSFIQYPGSIGLLSLPLLAPIPILTLQLAIEYLIGRRFERRMRRGIAKVIGSSVGDMFVGMHPGSGVRYTEGYSEWDWGFVTLGDDWFCYRGEKARFAIPRQDVIDIRVVSGRPCWLRHLRVEVRYSGGVFTITRNSTFSTRADVDSLARMLRKWAAGAASAAAASPRPEAPPILPRQPGVESSRLRAAWFGFKTMMKVWIAIPILVAADRHHPIVLMIVMLSTAFVVLLRHIPDVIWPIRRPLDKDAPETIPSATLTPA